MAADRLTVSAPAKINLYLKITGQREDGYHLLASLMQKISLQDTLDFTKAQSGILLTCPDSTLPEDERNLVYQAARLFLKRSADRLPGRCPGVAIRLKKTIPVAAGLGGGSSDAAAALIGLDTLFETRWSVDELLKMGVSLGADVPFFVNRRPAAWAEGIGEDLAPANPLAGYRILVVNPGFSVSTEWVYKNFALTFGQNINNLSNSQIIRFVGEEREKLTQRQILPGELENDLERVTINHYPEIGALKKRLLQSGAVAALMAGSGPSVFGLFFDDEKERAVACYEELKREYGKTFLVDPLQ